jgi:TldD protein
VSLDLLQDLMAKADGRCAYAEARHVHERSEHASVLNGDVEDVSAEETEGLGVRVRIGGGGGVGPPPPHPPPPGTGLALLVAVALPAAVAVATAVGR